MPPCYPPSKWPLAGLTQLAEQDLTQPSCPSVTGNSRGLLHSDQMYGD